MHVWKQVSVDASYLGAMIPHHPPCSGRDPKEPQLTDACTMHSEVKNVICAFMKCRRGAFCVTALKEARCTQR